MDKNATFQQIPSVDVLLNSPAMEELSRLYSRQRVRHTVRWLLGRLREELVKGERADVTPEGIAARTGVMIAAEEEPSLRRVINATGTIIHTNLGRAVLPRQAVEAMEQAAAGPVNLEYDLKKGARGERDLSVENLICRLTGAEAATVVNNNAAAVLIVLNTLAKKKEVIISRGELVEIGGAFRIPEIMKISGCRMVEVGTTNKTRVADFADAAGSKTGLILKVHTSNYKVIGFTESVDISALVTLGRNLSLPVVEDLGSGAIIDLAPYGLPKEPVVGEQIAKGVDLVTFSGDKLLGGPQAGIIAGKKSLIQKINKNPLKRALRVDKTTLAALEALFRLYLNPETLVETLPVLRFMTRPLREIEKVAGEALQGLKACFGSDIAIEIADDFSEAGSGSLPGETLPTKVLRLSHKRLSAAKLAAQFRGNRPPIIGRIHDDRFILDARCVEKGSDLVPQRSIPPNC